MNKDFLRKLLISYVVVMSAYVMYLCFRTSSLEQSIGLRVCSWIIADIDKETPLAIENLLNESMFNLVMQMFFIVVISSWSRAAGPRSRVDFLSDITWKKILFFIVLVLLVSAVIHLFT